MKNWTGGVLALFCILTASAHAADLERGKAQSVGMSDARLERLDAAMQAYVDDRKLAGIVTLVARRGKIVQFEAYGDADVESDLPMRKDSIFRIYSITKPIASVAVMMLFEEGRFLLSDPISKYIPELANPQVWISGEGDEMVTRPAAREVTIHDLLTHQSGYGYHIIPSVLSARYEAKGIVPGSRTVPNQARDLRDFVTRLSKEPLLNDPGEAWNYSVSTDVLGRLVEVLSGMPFDRFLDQRIFVPLGMKDTGFWVSQDNINRFTVNYMIDSAGRLAIYDSVAESQFVRPRELLSGGGGLLSTAADYAKFCQMMLNGGAFNGVRLLGPKTVELMTANHVPDDDAHALFYEGTGFGLGFSVTTNVAATLSPGSVGEYAWGGAASTIFWIDPKEELFAIMLTQMMPSGTYPLRDDMKALVYQAIVD
ncbi:MAG: serine hydrolase [Proteobacteria bacterium]|nr:serine hydrolase [Pseudomonadota bacterium]